MKTLARTPTHLLTDSVTIERASSTSDGRAPARAWATVTADVPCAVQPMKASKAQRYGSDRASRMYTVFFDPSVNLRERDRLAWFDDRRSVTRYLNVRSAPVDLVVGGAVLEIDAESVEGVD